jgi:meso-butanediol dehydrogenase/(S,S)-butanediol dehydrogenase/diacetyl reductase
VDGAGRFAGKVALITGGGTGIGAATARRLVAEGARVVLGGRRPEPLNAVAEEFGDDAFAAPGDAANPRDIARIVASAVERFGSLDLVVANAGGHGLGAAADIEDDEWRLSLDTNLNSAFMTIRAALPPLIERRGSIVVVSSIAGLFAGPAVAGYVTTKHALIGLTRSVARDYGRHGVRVNAVCPGWVRTPMADEQMDELGSARGIDRAGAYALVTRDTPLRRPAEPDEIASVIAFLLSSDASVMTGAVLVADAGAHAVDLPTIAFAQ